MYFYLGQKKLDKMSTPDAWNWGQRMKGKVKMSSTIMMTNKKLEPKSYKNEPYSKKCRICLASLPNYLNYCHRCSYNRGNIKQEYAQCVGKKFWIVQCICRAIFKY